MIAFSALADSSKTAPVDVYLPVKAAAEYSGYNTQYLRRLLQSGLLQGDKVGQVWLVKVSSLNAYLKSVREAGDRRFGPRVYQEYVESQESQASPL